MHLKDLNDDALFQKYVEGDIHAFRVLYGRMSPRIWAFVKKRVKDNGIAEDVFQEVWAKVHRSRSHYDYSRPALPWIFTIARSVLIDRMRSVSAIQEVSNDPMDLERLEPARMDSGPDLIDMREKALGSLPQHQQDLLNKRYLDEWTFEQLAQEAGVTEQTIRKRISRLLKQLRRDFGGTQK